MRQDRSKMSLHPSLPCSPGGMLRIRKCVLDDLGVMAQAVMHKLDTNSKHGIQFAEYKREPDLMNLVVQASLAPQRRHLSAQTRPHAFCVVLCVCARVCVAWSALLRVACVCVCVCVRVCVCECLCVCV